MFNQIKPGNTFGGRMLVPYKFYPNIIEHHFGPWAVKKKYSNDISIEELKKSKKAKIETFEDELKYER